MTQLFIISGINIAVVVVIIVVLAHAFYRDQVKYNKKFEDTWPYDIPQGYRVVVLKKHQDKFKQTQQLLSGNVLFTTVLDEALHYLLESPNQAVLIMGSEISMNGYDVRSHVVFENVKRQIPNAIICVVSGSINIMDAPYDEVVTSTDNVYKEHGEAKVLAILVKKYTSKEKPNMAAFFAV